MKKITAAAMMLLTFVLSACGAGPEEVASQFQAAINSQDTDNALGLLADDVVWQVDGTQYRTGKEEVQGWLAMQAELNFRIEGVPMAIEDGLVFQDCSISSAVWRFFGVNPMTGTCEMALERGLITSFVVKFDEDSQARLFDSPAASAAEIHGVWITLNLLDDSGDLYLQFFEDGNGRLANSPADSSNASESNTEGASLTWSYEDYVLTIQNDGPADEKYCQEQDVGNFLVKVVDEGGLKFKKLVDSCSLRGVAIEFPTRWRPYAP